MICFFCKLKFLSMIILITHHLSFSKVVLFLIYSSNCCVSGEIRGDGRATVSEVNQLPKNFTKITLEYLFQKMASCYGGGDGEGAGAVCEGLRGREELGHILPLRWTQR